MLLHRSIQNTLVYPVLLQSHVFLPLKRLHCLLFTLFSAPLCQIRIHFHNPYSPTYSLGFVLRQNKRNNFFQVVHSEVLESRQLGLKLTKENDFTSQLKRANGTKCNGRMTQLKTKQRRAIFHNNADVKILKIFLACTREHKKEKKPIGNKSSDLHCFPVFMTFTIVLFPPTRHEFKQLQKQALHFAKKTSTCSLFLSVF